MAQHINLHTPILLQPRRIFSARALGLSLAVLAAVLVVAGAAVHLLQAVREREFQQLRQAQQRERQQLEQALAAGRSQRDPTALAQQLQAAERDAVGLREQLAAIAHVQLAAGQHHSDTLALLARSLPASAWITGLQLGPDALEIRGMTLEPDALPRWIAALEASPGLQGRHLASVRVEQFGSPAAAHGGLPALPGIAPAPAVADVQRLRNPAWAFRISTPLSAPVTASANANANAGAAVAAAAGAPAPEALR